MATLLFKVEVPDDKEVDILAAFDAVYQRPADECVVGFVKEVYAASLSKTAVKAAQDKAASDAAAVPITKDKPV
jgi:hypothetical protein